VHDDEVLITVENAYAPTLTLLIVMNFLFFQFIWNYNLYNLFTIICMVGYDIS